MRNSRLLLLLAALIVAAGVVLPIAANADPGDPANMPDLSWTTNYTLFVTSADTNDEMYAAKAAVDAAGGRVGVIMPYRVMLGWIDPAKAASLVGKAGIQAVYQKPAAEVPAGLDARERDGVKYFNSIASGAYAAAKAKALQTAKQGIMLPDNREAPSISYADVVKNLEANGLTVDGLAAKGIVLSENPDGSLQGSGATNSAYMAGTAVFNAMYIESIGKTAAGAGDANTYTWTDAAHTTVRNEIVSGLNFWVTQANSAPFKVPLTFVYIDWYKFGNAGQTNYEPIKHSSGQDSLWINQIMANRGFSSGDKFARCAAFNAYFRNYYNANWSVLSFIGYNPSPAASTFTDGYFAYTWNTYTQLLYRNDGWGTTQYDIVNAHETGHIFGASDEYYQPGYGGCTSCGAASNGVLNGNCEYTGCNPTNQQPCMMNFNTLNLCGYTPGQIGWTNVRSTSASISDQKGKAKDFFAAGEKIQYRASFCIAGPRLGTRTHAVKVRFVSRYFGGALASGTLPVLRDTGWYNVGTVAPPATSGNACFTAWVNSSVPATATWGSASLDAMVEIVEIGRSQASVTGKYYVTGGAATTEDSPAASPALLDFDEPLEGGIIER